MFRIVVPLTLLILALLLQECAPNEEAAKTNMRFSFDFDSNQARLNNMGHFSEVQQGHGAQSPKFNTISMHYVELTPTEYTPLGSGAILYHHSETNAGGENAIEFSSAIISEEGETALEIPLASIPSGTYKYIRVSLAYQNYNIDFLANGIVATGSLASFVGFNTYIQGFTIKDQEVIINGNRKQGYWAFESPFGVVQGQAPEGATTVPNPLALTSPIPFGSCVVTGMFEPPLVISETSNDIDVKLSLSTNNSFEWIEVNQDGMFEPLAGEVVVDMGVRGLVPTATMR